MRKLFVDKTEVGAFCIAEEDGRFIRYFGRKPRQPRYITGSRGRINRRARPRRR
jgi:hypothetical protein